MWFTWWNFGWFLRAFLLFGVRMIWCFVIYLIRLKKGFAPFRNICICNHSFTVNWAEKKTPIRSIMFATHISSRCVRVNLSKFKEKHFVDRIIRIIRCVVQKIVIVLLEYIHQYVIGAHMPWWSIFGHQNGYIRTIWKHIEIVNATGNWKTEHWNIFIKNITNQCQISTSLKCDSFEIWPLN